MTSAGRHDLCWYDLCFEIDHRRFPSAVSSRAMEIVAVHLAPHEVDKLTLVTTGLLAQRRLARGLRLG
ncbi:MAG: urease subunit gamma, partial [Hyphomicrobiales bacterium]|nr:urease subunit gamma [Hyphomicrobiales bacterium]